MAKRNPKRTRPGKEVRVRRVKRDAGELQIPWIPTPKKEDVDQIVGRRKRMKKIDDLIKRIKDGIITHKEGYGKIRSELKKCYRSRRLYFGRIYHVETPKDDMGMGLREKYPILQKFPQKVIAGPDRVIFCSDIKNTKHIIGGFYDASTNTMVMGSTEEPIIAHEYAHAEYHLFVSDMPPSRDTSLPEEKSAALQFENIIVKKDLAAVLKHPEVFKDVFNEIYIRLFGAAPQGPVRPMDTNEINKLKSVLKWHPGFRSTLINEAYADARTMYLTDPEGLKEVSYRIYAFIEYMDSIMKKEG